MLKLNIGSGTHRLDGYLNVDRIPEADVQTDLETGKLPFEDESVERILASHVLEHITNLIPLMNDCRRILKSGGDMTILVPDYGSIQAFQDPTHCRYFTENTLRYWLKGDYLHEDCGRHYGILPWSDLEQTKSGWQIMARLIK